MLAGSDIEVTAHEPSVVEPIGFIDNEVRVYVLDEPSLALINTLKNLCWILQRLGSQTKEIILKTNCMISTPTNRVP